MTGILEADASENDYDPYAKYQIVQPTDTVREGDLYKQWDALTGQFTFYPITRDEKHPKRMPGVSASEWRYGIIRPVEVTK